MIMQNSRTSHLERSITTGSAGSPQVVKRDPRILSELRWIERTIQGDNEAFQHIVTAYQAAVFSLCWRLLGDAQRAEDAAQETFFKAFKHLNHYQPERRFLNWILTIACHHCIDRLRRRRVRTTPLDDASFRMASTRAENNPESRLIQREQEDVISELLSTLKPEDRAAILLFYWFDCSQKEIARVLQTTEPAIKSRLHRSRKALAARLGELRSGDPNSHTNRIYPETLERSHADSLKPLMDTSRLEQVHV